MQNEEIKTTHANVPLIIRDNDDIKRISDLEDEVKEYKAKYERLHQETELLRNPEIQKITFSIPIEKLPTSKELVIHQKVSKTSISLPNGTQGKPYECSFDLVKLGLSEIKYFELIGLDKFGLHYDNSTKKIEGTPTEQGDFTVLLRYKFDDVNNDKPFLDKTISFVINPDPRSLWRTLDSDKNDKYWKLDSDHFTQKIENKQLVIASQRGRSHAQDGKFRDDHFQAFQHDSSKWSVVTIADGAGSAKFSRHGSLLTCNEISAYFENLTIEKYEQIDTAVLNFYENQENSEAALKRILYTHLAGVAYKAFKSIEQEAISRNEKVKDYGTTIMFTIFKKYEFGWFFASFGVGDSPMGIYTIKQPPIIMHYPEEGEYSGQTYFLTMPEIFKDGAEIIKRISYKIIPDFTAVVLMTDGIYDPKFETRANLDKLENWDNIWNDLNKSIELSDENPNLSEELLKWLDFWSAGNHDDRTIAILF
jgi:serine/threonine protein phosphatase PrpC